MADPVTIASGIATGVTIAYIIWRDYGRKHDPPPAPNGGSVVVTLPGPKPTVDVDELANAIEMLKRAAVQNQRAIAQNKRDVDADIEQLRVDMTDFSGDTAERILKLMAKIRQLKGISPP